MGRRHNKSGVADVIRAFQMTDNLHLAADVVDELCGISYTARRSVLKAFIYHVISTSLRQIRQFVSDVQICTAL